MLAKHNHTPIQPKNSASNAVATPENIQIELEEARFISSFMTSVCSSLELDEICSIAARALYIHAPYCRLVFTFSKKLEGKIVTISPMFQNEGESANSKSMPCPDSGLHGSALVSAHLELLDNLGTVAIYHKADQDKTLSDSLLVNIATCFSQAIKNTLEHSRIKDLAMRDGLTNLFNRRIFDETLAQKIKCSDMLPVSLLIIDLDNFKQVNDTFGHQAGDQVLRTFADILKDSCRGQDMVARFGGEEFAIILSQTKTATANAIAQRIRNRLAKTVFTFEDQQHRMTVSIGLATCQTVNTIFTSNLVKQADRALYQAKKTGKNKVCVFPADLLDEAVFTTNNNSPCQLIPAGC